MRFWGFPVLMTNVDAVWQCLSTAAKMKSLESLYIVRFPVSDTCGNEQPEISYRINFLTRTASGSLRFSLVDTRPKLLIVILRFGVARFCSHNPAFCSVQLITTVYDFFCMRLKFRHFPRVYGIIFWVIWIQHVMRRITTLLILSFPVRSVQKNRAKRFY